MGEIAPEGLPVEGEPVVEEAPWAGPSQEEWAATQEYIQRVGPLVEQFEQWQNAPEEEPAGVGLDPFSETFQQQLDAYLDQKMAPISSYTQEQQMGEAEARAMDIINDLQVSEGEFLFDKSPGMARELANRYIGEEQQKFGFGPKAAEAALSRAYKEVREWEQAIGKAYYERETNQLSTLAGARREPGAAGTAGAEQFAAPEGGDEHALVQKYRRAGLLG